MPASGHSLCGVCGDFALLLGNTSVVVHDIDPINIFVRNAGSQIVVRWIDFVTWKKDHRNEPYCSDVLCQNATLLLQQNAWSTIGHCGAAAVAAANPSHKPLNCPDFGPPRRCCPRLHRPEAMSATAVCRRTRWRRRGQLVGASPAGPGGVESLGLAASGPPVGVRTRYAAGQPASAGTPRAALAGLVAALGAAIGVFHMPAAAALAAVALFWARFYGLRGVRTHCRAMDARR